MNEIWKVIADYPDYEVSNMGRVRSNKRNKQLILVGPPNTNGYPSVSLRHNNVQANLAVHRLVLTAFVGDCPDGCECRHLDGCRTNNRLDNLEWSTHTVNCQD